MRGTTRFSRTRGRLKAAAAIAMGGMAGFTPAFAQQQPGGTALPAITRVEVTAEVIAQVRAAPPRPVTWRFWGGLPRRIRRWRQQLRLGGGPMPPRRVPPPFASAQIGSGRARCCRERGGNRAVGCHGRSDERRPGPSA